MLKQFLAKICLTLLGRRNYYRLARFLWLDARRDGANAMSSNGERDVQAAIARVARDATPVVTLDIGANIGEYTETMLGELEKHGVSESRHFCFEPNPACVRAIESRLGKLSNGGSAEVVRKIVTDQPGTTSFFITGETAGSSSLRIDEQTQKATKIDAECLTLKMFCEEREVDEILFAPSFSKNFQG